MAREGLVWSDCQLLRIFFSTLFLQNIYFFRILSSKNKYIIWLVKALNPIHNRSRRNVLPQNVWQKLRPSLHRHCFQARKKMKHQKGTHYSIIKTLTRSKSSMGYIRQASFIILLFSQNTPTCQFAYSHLNSSNHNFVEVWTQNSEKKVSFSSVFCCDRPDLRFVGEVLKIWHNKAKDPLRWTVHVQEFFLWGVKIRPSGIAFSHHRMRPWICSFLLGHSTQRRHKLLDQKVQTLLLWGDQRMNLQLSAYPHKRKWLSLKFKAFYCPETDNKHAKHWQRFELTMTNRTDPWRNTKKRFRQHESRVSDQQTLWCTARIVSATKFGEHFLGIFFQTSQAGLTTQAGKRGGRLVNLICSEFDGDHQTVGKKVYTGHINL